MLLYVACPARVLAQAPVEARRAQVFAAQRRAPVSAADSPAALLMRARAQSAAMAGIPRADAVSFSPPWQAVGPVQVQSLNYGAITGRVTSVAVDPADASGNTVYLGTTGGGVWKSTDAAGSGAQVRFLPLTDNLSVFSSGVAGSVTASLSIGAVSVQPGGTGVVLAGTGDPNDATDSYYGQGILRSTDNGQTWSLVEGSNDGAAGQHMFTGKGFAGFAWSSTTPGLVAAAVSSSAEGAIVGAGAAGASVEGLYVSTDAGATWQMSSITDGGALVQGPQTDFSSYSGNAATAVVFDPVRGMFVAAVRSHGYYQSADGATWTRMANQPGTGLSAANCPARTGLPGAATCPIQRGALAVQPASGDLFALTVDAAGNDQGLWQDVCSATSGVCASGTVTWGNQISTAPLDTAGAIPSGNYDLVLAAIPAATALSTSDTLLFAGTGDLFRCSLAGGCTLRNTTNATDGCSAPAMVAPAQHAIGWALNASDSATPLVFFGNDGGLWRSTDGVNQTGTVCSLTDAAHFDNLNPALGSLAEVVSVASDPASPDVLLAGLGGNGSAEATISAAATAASPWPQISAGESGSVSIGQTDGTTWTVQSGGGVSLHTCTAGASCTPSDFSGPPQVGAAQTAGDASLPDPSAMLDPGLGTNLLVGTCRVWRGPSGGGWSAANAISPIFAGTCTSTSGLIRSMAAGGPVAATGLAQTSGASVLYAGLAGVSDGGGASGGGHLFVTTSANNGGAWADITGTPVANGNGVAFNASRFDISGIAMDPHDATGKTVYATVMGFGVPHAYRSTNAGAGWTNITSNLPDAPANAVAVDPGNAAIVYVATDTGVYATTDVTTCGTVQNGTAVNCWTPLGTGLPDAPVTILVATAGVQLPGASAAGALRAGTYGRGIWQMPLLSATVTGSPALSLSPTSLNFAAQTPGTTSAPQTVTVTNSGSAPLVIASVAASAGFGASGNCGGATIAPGAGCTVQVTYAPSTTAAQTGTLTLTSNSGGTAGTTSTVTLNGASSGSFTVVLQPTAVDFGSIPVGTTSPAQNITISNTGTLSGTVGSATVTGDFRITASTCGATLAPNTGCTISIAFSPAASGTRTGTFTLQAGDGTHAAALSGAGTSPATDALSPASLTFAAQTVGTSSVAQTVTLTNNGDAQLTLVNAQVTSGDFSATNGCGATVPGHTSCSISVVFAPRSAGPQTGTLTITDVQRSQTVTLNGSGLPAPGVSLSPTSVQFADTGVGVATAPAVVTLSNTGGSPVTISSVSATGDFGTLAGSTTCASGSTLQPAGTCTVPVVFAPQAAGARTGTLTLATSAGAKAVALSGTGVDFSLAAETAASQTLMSGASATFGLLLTPAQTSSDAVTFACTGAPAASTCVVTPQYGNLSATGTVVVTVQTGVSTSAVVVRRPSQLAGLGAAVAALLLPLVPLGRRRRLGPLLLVCLCVALLSGVSGCGAGRPMLSTTAPTTPVGGGGGTTASGSYPITVSATATGLTRTVTLTVVVQ